MKPKTITYIIRKGNRNFACTWASKATRTGRAQWKVQDLATGTYATGTAPSLSAAREAAINWILEQGT